jgi:hypothetical protein
MIVSAVGIAHGFDWKFRPFWTGRQKLSHCVLLA